MEEMMSPSFDFNKAMARAKQQYHRTVERQKQTIALLDYQQMQDIPVTDAALIIAGITKPEAKAKYSMHPDTISAYTELHEKALR